MDEILINTEYPRGITTSPARPVFAARNSSYVWADRPDRQYQGPDARRERGQERHGVRRQLSRKAPGTKRQLPAVIETAQGFVVAWIEQLTRRSVGS